MRVDAGSGANSAGARGGAKPRHGGGGGAVTRSCTDGGFASVTTGGGSVLTNRLRARSLGAEAAAPISRACHCASAFGGATLGSASANCTSPASSSENAVSAISRTSSIAAAVVRAGTAGGGCELRARRSLMRLAISGWPPRSNAICA
jgi:hypothetical protein